MYQVKDIANGNIKYSGISRAVVIDNNDPLKRGRIRVNSPVLGETGWIPYLTQPGTFNVPDTDSVVYIQCDSGYYTHPVAWGNFNYGDDFDLQFPEEFQRVSPTNRGIYTPGNLLLEIDDGLEPINHTKRGVRLTTAGSTTIDLKDELVDKSLSLAFASGINLKIDSVADSFLLETAAGDSIELSSTGGLAINTNLSLDFESTVGSITLKALGGATLKLANGQVALGTSTAELLDLFDQTLDSFINNAPTIVSTAVGPGILSPAVVALLTNIKILLTLIKGSI